MFGILVTSPCTGCERCVKAAPPGKALPPRRRSARSAGHCQLPASARSSASTDSGSHAWRACTVSSRPARQRVSLARCRRPARVRSSTARNGASAAVTACWHARTTSRDTSGTPVSRTLKKLRHVQREAEAGARRHASKHARPTPGVRGLCTLLAKARETIAASRDGTPAGLGRNRVGRHFRPVRFRRGSVATWLPRRSTPPIRRSPTL